MTADALGLVASPTRMSASRYSDNGKWRERDRPLSSSSSGHLPRLDTLAMTRKYDANDTPSHHSLSSTGANSPQGSIPSIPSPPPEPSNRYTRQTPLQTRVPTQPDESTSPPPTLSRNNASGHTSSKPSQTEGKSKASSSRSERSSEVGSSASSLSLEELLSGE